MKLLKPFLVALLLLMGVLLLYEGLGLDFRILDYERLEAYGIPLGIAFIVVGVLMARFWTIVD